MTKALRGKQFIKTILAKGDLKSLLNDLERLHNEYYTSLASCEQDIKVTKNFQGVDEEELQHVINLKKQYQKEARFNLRLILYANEKTINELKELMPPKYEPLINELMEFNDYEHLTPIISFYKLIKQNTLTHNY